ncbi:alpha/beta hydrolase [Cryptosporangium aurantiacum]|uniref:Lysophospholipase, alpha-beta hydrolase superfamily n=1 Tax=Cryptosporangium aurantiacum TaxID=134849 RepID=A0A1M7QA20_9ACTN|nr:alpha/beta hydrolase [Cryptosporangium aurantiacum]SHN27189.1 Lysophospholipase, alpha-beta hydrolase superfamily [Cryptosporangium aurantiacum]
MAISTEAHTWTTDVLGAPYEQYTIPLGSDDQGEVVATLVRRRADRPTGRAVLHVHGFVDYFFQTHLADRLVESGFDFYAIDLRKYGRSLRPHQTPYFCRSLTEYFADLDAAVRIIREQDSHETVLVHAHSTGGLVTPLWVHRHRTERLVDGLALNSPFFDMNQPRLVRGAIDFFGAPMGTFRPYQVLPAPSSNFYGRSLHRDHAGEWDYDLAWKPMSGVQIHAGWLRAIRNGHRRIEAGLAIEVPILVACSTATFRSSRWDESVLRTDAVLDVEHIASRAHRLGRQVTLVRIENGVHDLALSAPPVRERYLEELLRWVETYV